MPVVEPEAGVSVSSSGGGSGTNGGVLRVSQGRGCGHRGLDRLISVKVDPDLEGGGKAADGGVSRARGGDGQEVATNSGHSGDCCRGGGGVLKGGDLKVVSEGDLVIIDGIEGGHPGADGAH